jgi:hypothetical protein
MKIIDAKQNSEAWLRARLGKVTASEADALISPEGKVRTGAGPHSYLCHKVAEKVLGYSVDTFQGSRATDQGNIIETMGLPWYSFAFDTPLTRVGFCETDDGRAGCSPDSLIGEDGGLELKSPQPPAHVEYLLAGVVPKDYRIQVQFSLWVTRRKWWKFVSYSSQFESLVVHVEPDPLLQEAISESLAKFAPLFDAAVARVSKGVIKGSDSMSEFKDRSA